MQNVRLDHYVTQSELPKLELSDQADRYRLERGIGDQRFAVDFHVNKQAYFRREHGGRDIPLAPGQPVRVTMEIGVPESCLWFWSPVPGTHVSPIMAK